MMSNMFSIFDPSSSLMNLNWYMMMTPAMFAFSRTMKSSKTYLMKKTMSNYMNSEISPILNNMKSPSFLILISIFFTLMIMNLSSLMPFNFTTTSQVSLNFPLATSIWLSFLIMGWKKNTMHMAAHLLPQGTPVILMPLMVMIESTSQLIRPITLAVRLTANMVAGHLLLSLLGELSVKTPMLTILLIPASLILTFLEICVSLIQAYVFTALITLYISEIK